MNAQPQIEEFQLIPTAQMTSKERRAMNRSDRKGLNRVIAHRMLTGAHPRFETLGKHLNSFKRFILFGLTF